jgi:hypothetical protein
VGQDALGQHRGRRPEDRAAEQLTDADTDADADAVPAPALTVPIGDAVPAPDRHAAPDGDAAADDRGHHRAADLAGAHPVADGERVGDSITGLAGSGSGRVAGSAVSAAGRPPRTAWAG